MTEVEGKIHFAIKRQFCWAWVLYHLETGAQEQEGTGPGTRGQDAPRLRDDPKEEESRQSLFPFAAAGKQ